MFKLLGHPLHPVFVHFPIVCWSLASIFDVVTFLELFLVWEMAGILHVIGTLVAVFTMLTGMLDLTKIPEDDAAALKTANIHMLLIMATWCFYACSVFLRVEGMHITRPDLSAMILSLIGFVLLMVAGWFGGKLVYTHGVGVE